MNKKNIILSVFIALTSVLSSFCCEKQAVATNNSSSYSSYFCGGALIVGGSILLYKLGSNLLSSYNANKERGVRITWRNSGSYNLQARLKDLKEEKENLTSTKQQLETDLNEVQKKLRNIDEEVELAQNSLSSLNVDDDE